jgi:TetR/AcrR family transcriptional regulator
MTDLAERRLEEKERRRDDILDAAEAVAMKLGLDRMTMDQVARKARLSRALLYVYFKDKDDLLFGVTERAHQLLRTRFVEAAARKSTGLTKILAIGHAYVTFCEEFSVYFAAMARFEAHEAGTQESPNVERCLTSCQGVHAVMVEVLQQGIADGSIRSDAGDLRVIAVTLWGFMHGILQIIATKADVIAHTGVSTQQLIENALLMCTRALQATP